MAHWWAPFMERCFHLFPILASPQSGPESKHYLQSWVMPSASVASNSDFNLCLLAIHLLLSLDKCPFRRVLFLQVFDRLHWQKSSVPKILGNEFLITNLTSLKIYSDFLPLLKIVLRIRDCLEICSFHMFLIC